MRPEIKKQVINRLNRAEGQLGGLRRMVDKDKYCIDIIVQSSAIRRALSAVEDLMLENHLTTHVLEQMRSGNENLATEEIVDVFKKIKKK